MGIKVPPEDLSMLRMLHNEIERTRLVLDALDEKFHNEIFIATGVDVEDGEWELDLDTGELYSPPPSSTGEAVD